MTTSNKNFKVKNGLNVAGTATFDTDIVLGTAPVAFDSITNRLKIYINGSWSPIAFSADIPDLTQQLNFLDFTLTLDYDGVSKYTLSTNGPNITGDSKFVDGGSVDTASFDLVFDSGVLQ